MLDPRSGEPQSGQACITYPNPEQPGTNLDTPHWEGLRQAWYDHRYVHTLRQAIDAREPDDPQARQAADSLRRVLAGIPWNGESSAGVRVSHAALARARSAIAEAIERLSGNHAE